MGNFDFVHISEDNSLTITISKNSPPLAAISDEELPQVNIEPANEMTLGKNTRVLLAGQKSFWPELKKVSDNFSREQIRKVKLQAFEQKRMQRELSVNIPEQLLAEIKKNNLENRKLEKLSELLNLVRPVNFQTIAATGISVRGEVHLIPSVTNAYRGLPSGEEVIPQGLQISTKSYTSSRLPSAFINSIGGGTPGGSGIPGGNTNKVASVGSVNLSTKSMMEIPTIRSASMAAQVLEQMSANDVSDSPAVADKAPSGGSYTIHGQIELSGGLAITHEINNLKVQWKTGTQTVDGTVDYTQGLYSVNVPAYDSGKIIATLKDSHHKLLGRGDFDLNGATKEDLSIQMRKSDGVKITLAPINSAKTGEIVSAYSYDNVKILAPGAMVMGAAQTRDEADPRGAYKLSGLGGSSSFILEAGAPDYWGTRLVTETAIKERVPLFSNKMMQSLFDLAGEPGANNTYAVIWGQVNKRSKPLAGVKVSLSAQGAVGPIYFNDWRIPDKKLNATSANGLYAFIKVKQGIHVVSTEMPGHVLPSSVVVASPGFVSYAEINLKWLEVSGKISDVSLSQSVSAQISVVGTKNGFQSGSQGFSAKLASTDPVLYLDANAGSDYFVSREAILRSEAKDIDIQVYRKAWLLAQMSQNNIKQYESAGILLGKYDGTTFRVSLDNEVQADENIFYFDESGNIAAGKTESGAEGGLFLLTNLKPGLHTLLVSTADGEMTNSRVFVSEAGILNVVNGEITP